MTRLALAMLILASSAMPAAAQIVLPPNCRPGPAGAIICDQTTPPGTSTSAPAYVVIYPYSSPPPPMRQPQNELQYRAGLRDYCRQNLNGCGPLR